MNFLAPRILRWFLEFLKISINPALNAIGVIIPKGKCGKYIFGAWGTPKKKS